MQMWEVNLLRLFLTVFDQTRKLITSWDELWGGGGSRLPPLALGP